MAESISSAKALFAFFSSLPTPKPNRSVTTLSTIAEKYSVAPNGLELFELLHAQRGNLLSLIAALDGTNWPKETKKASRLHLSGLLGAIDHNGLLKDWRDTQAKLVAPNVSALLLLEQSLGLQNDLADDEEREIHRVVGILDDVLKDVQGSELPMELRGKIVSALSTLVFMLRNYKVVGVARAWEVASSALMSLSLETQGKPEARSGTLKKVMKALAAGVAMLAVVNGFVKETADMIPNVRTAFGAVSGLFQDDQKLIEHRASPSGERPDKGD